MPRTQPIGLRHGIRGGAIVASATSSGGARPSHTRKRAEPGQRDDARGRSASRRRRPRAARRRRPRSSTEHQADGVGAGPEGRSSRHLVPDDEREDRPRETHAEPDPERQREDENRARDREPEQPEADDQDRARRERPARAQSPRQQRRERREDPHAQDGDRAERAGHAVRDAEPGLDAREQRTDGDDLGPEDQRDRERARRAAGPVTGSSAHPARPDPLRPRPSQPGSGPSTFTTVSLARAGARR